MLPSAERLEYARRLDIPMPRSRHTFSSWARALDAYAEVRLVEAAARTGVSERTLARWARRARVLPGKTPREREAAARTLVAYWERQRRLPWSPHCTLDPDDRLEALVAIVGVTPPGRRPWRRRSRHSAATRELALREYRDVGPREAARRTRVPLSTLARWAARSGAEAPSGTAERTRAATQARKAGAARRQRAVVASVYGMSVEEVEAFTSSRTLVEATQGTASVRRRLAQSDGTPATFPFTSFPA